MVDIDRSSNEQLTSLRSELRSLYGNWTSSKKSSVSYLPRASSADDIDRIGKLISEEIERVDVLKKKCDELVAELQKEKEKLINQ